MTRLDKLNALVNDIGVYVDSHNGQYKFDFSTEPVDYFQCNGIITVKGLKAATMWAEGYSTGFHACLRKHA